MRAAALEGLDLSLTQLDDLVEGCGPGIREIIKRETDRMHAEARAAAARIGKTRRYSNAIRKIFFDDGMTGRVFVAPIATWGHERLRRGWEWLPKNVPIWLEYGTRKAADVPHLLPALERARTRMGAAVLELMERLAQG